MNTTPHRENGRTPEMLADEVRELRERVERLEKDQTVTTKSAPRPWRVWHVMTTFFVSICSAIIALGYWRDHGGEGASMWSASVGVVCLCGVTWLALIVTFSCMGSMGKEVHR